MLSGYDTDKSDSYLQTYKQYFAPFVDKEVKLLELGVNKGGSLLMWRDYFSRGSIVGLDLRPVELNEPRIHLYQGHQEDASLLTRIAQEHAPNGFDIIIDDCAHFGELARKSFWHLFVHHLVPGGIYAIEDWGTGYWNTWPDGKGYRQKDGETLLHRLANLRRNYNPFSPPRHKYTRKFSCHNYGMVGFIKQLVDECGMGDITHPKLGRPPLRPSRISRMTIQPGLVVVHKA